MVRVLVLHQESSGSSDNPSKTRVIHIVLSIIVMERGVNELTPKTPFSFSQKKKKNVELYSSW